jgi:hypothetical protein
VVSRARARARASSFRAASSSWRALDITSYVTLPPGDRGGAGAAPPTDSRYAEAEARSGPRRSSLRRSREARPAPAAKEGERRRRCHGPCGLPLAVPAWVWMLPRRPPLLLRWAALIGGPMDSRTLETVLDTNLHHGQGRPGKRCGSCGARSVKTCMALPLASRRAGANFRGHRGGADEAARDEPHLLREGASEPHPAPRRRY